MLAELAAANAAFAIVKQAVQNSGEIASAGQALISYFNNKNTLQKKANAKGGGSDMEEFLALEQLKAQEEELREMMIYSGRPGLWQDWIKFQAEAARQRREAEAQAARERALRRQRLYQVFEYVLVAVLAIVGLAAIGAVVWAISGRGYKYG